MVELRVVSVKKVKKKVKQLTKLKKNKLNRKPKNRKISAKTTKKIKKSALKNNFQNKLQNNSTTAQTAPKPRVGIFGITGCMGCQLNIVYQTELFRILDKIDLVAFPVGKESNDLKGNYDLVFVEGVVVCKEDLEFIQDLRKRTKILVAIGACATDGCVPAIRNFIDTNNAMKVVYGDQTSHLQIVDPTPIDKHVKVDYYIRGCPSDKDEITQFLLDIFSGKEFRIDEKSICHNCNLQGNSCLIEQGKECLGPVTHGNCSVMCTHYGGSCIGCRGPYADANFEAYFKVMESKGYSRKHILQRMNKFAGIKFKEMIEGQQNLYGNADKDGCNSMFCNVKEENKSSLFCPPSQKVLDLKAAEQKSVNPKPATQGEKTGEKAGDKK